MELLKIFPYYHFNVVESAQNAGMFCLHLKMLMTCISPAVWWSILYSIYQFIWSRILCHWILLYPIDFLSNCNPLNYSESVENLYFWFLLKRLRISISHVSIQRTLCVAVLFVTSKALAKDYLPIQLVLYPESRMHFPDNWSLNFSFFFFLVFAIWISWRFPSFIWLNTFFPQFTSYSHLTPSFKKKSGYTFNTMLGSILRKICKFVAYQFHFL